MRLTLPLPPSSNRYWRRAGTRLHISNEAKAYRELVGMLTMGRRLRDGLLTGPIAVTMEVYFPNRRGDLQNREKQLLDALQGRAFVNDSQVHELHMYRKIDKANPRVEISIEEVGADG